MKPQALAQVYDLVRIGTDLMGTRLARGDSDPVATSGHRANTLDGFDDGSARASILELVARSARLLMPADIPDRRLFVDADTDPRDPAPQPGPAPQPAPPQPAPEPTPAPGPPQRPPPPPDKGDRGTGPTSSDASEQQKTESALDDIKAAMKCFGESSAGKDADSDKSTAAAPAAKSAPDDDDDRNGRQTGSAADKLSPTSARSIDAGDAKSISKGLDPGSSETRGTADPDPEKASGDGFIGDRTVPKEPSLQGVGQVGEAIGLAVDSISILLDSLKGASLSGRGAGGMLQTASNLLTASNAYDAAHSPLDFMKEIAKSAISGYAAKVAGEKAVEALVAGGAAGIETLSFGPAVAAGAGTIVGVGTLLATTYAGEIFTSIHAYAAAETTAFYAYLDREITNLYMRKTWP